MFGSKPLQVGTRAKNPTAVNRVRTFRRIVVDQTNDRDSAQRVIEERENQLRCPPAPYTKIGSPAVRCRDIMVSRHKRQITLLAITV